MWSHEAPSDLDYRDPFGNDDGERTYTHPVDDLSSSQRAFLMARWRESGSTVGFDVWRRTLQISDLLRMSLEVIKEKDGVRIQEGDENQSAA